jgi:hypothetical protein
VADAFLLAAVLWIEIFVVILRAISPDFFAATNENAGRFLDIRNF